MLADFVHAYIKAALWSSNDESDERGGNPLDDSYSEEDISPETMAKIQADCEEFLRLAGHLITDDNCKYKGCSAVEYAGHDFWLTRCGHGSGFWDGDWKEPAASELTALCKKFGNVDLYVGDDGKVWN